MMTTALPVMARTCRPSTTFLATVEPGRGRPVRAGDDWDAQNLASARRQHFTESKRLREKAA
jgi:hypothetical protein